jgi:hypothetical protein
LLVGERYEEAENIHKTESRCYNLLRGLSEGDLALKQACSHKRAHMQKLRVEGDNAQMRMKVVTNWVECECASAKTATNLMLLCVTTSHSGCFETMSPMQPSDIFLLAQS